MNDNHLGETIRAFRLRRRQPHNGRPWALEDLAVVTGFDRAHLSRIERGLVHPSRATVLRIAEGLALSRQETEYLLSLSGHTLPFAPPDEAEIQEAIRWLSTMTRGYAHPVILRSNDLRLWYVNAMWLRLTGLTPAEFRTCVRGHGATEWWMNACPTWQRIFTRFRSSEETRRQTVMRFRTGVLGGEVPDSLLESIQGPPGDTQRASASTLIPADPMTLDLTISLWYPGRGRLRFHTWHMPLPINRRFHVTHYLPKDAATRHAFSAIRGDPRPRGDVPCPIHPPVGRDGPLRPPDNRDHGHGRMPPPLSAG